MFVIPFLGTLLFYSRILFKIRHVEKQVVSLHAKAHHRSLHNVAVMVLVVLTTTIACWAPITVYWLMLYTMRSYQYSYMSNNYYLFSPARTPGETCCTSRSTTDVRYAIGARH